MPNIILNIVVDRLVHACWLDERTDLNNVVGLFLRVEEHRMRHQNGILLTFISVIVTRQLGY